MSTPTPDAVKAKLQSIIDGDLIVNLWARWQDESEYEDIEEYGKAMAKSYDCTIHKCKKRPFGFIISFPEFPAGQYEVQCSSRSTRWRRVA